MDILKELGDNLSQGRPFVLATLLRASGSVPRQPGAKMIVYPDGQIAGTIGGGNFEKLVIEDCLTLYYKRVPNLLKTYRFTASGPDATGMCCGGEADVFIEAFLPPEALYIFGGGHIGRQLSNLAIGLGFRITVIDDRPEILSQYQSPIETILTDSDYRSNLPAFDCDSYVVIVTRSHHCDLTVLRQVVGRGCAYVGMIGSRRKIATAFGELEKDGVSPEKLKQVHAPIGIDIGAEGPYEIALAIAAELVAVRSRYRKERQIAIDDQRSTNDQGK